MPNGIWGSPINLPQKVKVLICGEYLVASSLYGLRRSSLTHLSCMALGIKKAQASMMLKMEAVF